MPDPHVARIVNAAREWIGTPYEHQHSTKGRGTDCLGLIRGVWREVVGREPVHVPPYTADWSESSRQERLWDAARQWLIEIPVDDQRVGTVVLFRMHTGSVAKHVAILAQDPSGMATIIHAYSRRSVVETPLTPHWRDRIVAQFEYPIGSK